MWKLPAAMLALRLMGLAQAHRWDWVKGLPDCWGKCLKDSGCNSKSCICDSSQDGDYLTGAVGCTMERCGRTGTNGWRVELALLAPLDMFCAATDEPVPADIMSSAYARLSASASASARSPTPTSTRNTKTKARTTHPPSTTSRDADADHGLGTTITSTVTMTTTDQDGHTLQVLIPIVMGPTSIATGAMVTSTLPTPSQSSPTTEQTSASQSQQQPLAPSTLSAPAEPTRKSGGSPFDTQTGAAYAQRRHSGAWLGMGLLAALSVSL